MITIKNIKIDEKAKHIFIDNVDIKEAESVWAQLAKGYLGFTVDFCFYNTLAPEKFLVSVGAEVLDNCLEMRLAEKDFVELQTKKATQATAEDFASLGAYHDKKNPKMYWSSEKILADFDSWDVFIMPEDGETTAYALMRDGWNIYCVVADGIEDRLALLSAAAKKSFAAQDRDVLFMADRDNFMETGAALHLGFRREGYYIAYRVKI
ncbi:MAG: hypothetical protein FWC76_00855 [Defluviitaleaceae bacterium]|nr:hypothetical protein [Defluviitaleaceae bacterium]